jgi:uncharacterized protein YjiS (DUF1127 family)
MAAADLAGARPRRTRLAGLERHLAMPWELFAALCMRAARRRAEDELRRLSDRALADLGLRRIDAAAPSLRHPGRIGADG